MSIRRMYEATRAAVLSVINVDLSEFCPHCGYYCTGETVFCTKGTEMATYSEDRHRLAMAKSERAETTTGEVEGTTIKGYSEELCRFGAELSHITEQFVTLARESGIMLSEDRKAEVKIDPYPEPPSGSTTREQLRAAHNSIRRTLLRLEQIHRDFSQELC